MDLERRIALYHTRMETKHAARRTAGKTLLDAQAARWDLKWKRRAAKFKAPITVTVTEKTEKPTKPISVRLKKEIKIKKKKAKKLRKKIEEIKPKRKVEEIISAVKAELKPKKKEKKIKLKPKVKEKIIKPVEKIEEKPKIEKPEEKKPVETVTVVGAFTDVSVPKAKGEKEPDWSAERFKELDEKLKKLRRF